jgi:preprotein translocase subunit YajC
MPANGVMQDIFQLSPLILIGVVFYMLVWRPQQQRMKEHQKTIRAVKRGDTVVLSSGLIGKVVRVEETEVGVEVAQGVTVKVVKDMIHTVRSRGAPVAANDAKA